MVLGHGAGASTPDPGHVLILQEDGNLVIYDRVASSIWASNTGHSGVGSGVGKILRGVGSNRCADVPSTADNAQATIQDCASGRAATQTWTWTADRDLRLANNKCLEARASGTAPGTLATISTCRGAANQKWQLNGDGTVTNVLSGLSLEVQGAATANGSKLLLNTPTGASNQKWVLN